MKTQASTTLTRGGRAVRLGAALLFVLLPMVCASARVLHNDAWARQQFAKAERMREALNGRPAGQRTRREYQRVIDSYRSVYFGSPASSKADPSVVATAELMVEMGRRFDDNKILRGAIEQYHFLRKEYPGSRYRFDALFTIGEIYKDDLDDPTEARKTFEDFLHRYPRNRLSDDAHIALKEMDAEASEREHAAQKAARKERASGAKAGVNAANKTGNFGSGNSNDTSGTGNHADEEDDSANASSALRSGLPRVTGVRHWSTPDYTRVAIDVEQEIKFDSQRIAHPDRIFFDLRDTRLASTLVGKTFDVDDGFLKKIRVAESQPGRTRIVLEVDDLANYDAFLLPDPYRLIIDIHGKDTHGKDIHEKQAGTSTASAVAASVSAAPSGDSDATVSHGGVAKSDAHPTQHGSGKNAAGPRKPGLVETDLLPEEDSERSKPSDSAKPAQGSGIVKTTIAVKGSDRRIPKTIVDGNGEVPAAVASLERDKTQPVAASDDDEIKPTKSDASSSSPSSASVRRKKSRAAADAADLHLDRGPETREARPTASGDRSLTRALGLKIGKIVIDAGHGGHDTGTIGPNGLLEKDVVLDVAKRLGRLLESRLGAEVIYTRQDDTFIPLETRTAIANRERADLFISIHANSSRDSDARGVETYYLNFTSSPEALEVAARENAVSEKSIHELQDLVKKIALKDKIDESREFAGDVQQSLYGGLALENTGIRNRGIKKAPFIVLIGANMPSILAEISFVSNPTDERKLETSEHRQRIAESLYRGVSKYVNGLSGVKVASKIDKSEGQ
ncbi:MAG: N-acetylmuramoyl-L-alanine amidase [Terriglobales bacterium]